MAHCFVLAPRCRKWLVPLQATSLLGFWRNLTCVAVRSADHSVQALHLPAGVKNGKEQLSKEANNEQLLLIGYRAHAGLQPVQPFLEFSPRSDLATDAPEKVRIRTKRGGP